MCQYTPYQSRYFQEQLTLRRPSNDGSIVPALAGAKVDLNPHQVDAALFAFQSPLTNGALLADEVGLGKTIEAGICIAQYWAEHKRKILLIVPASLRNQWLSELDEKFYIKSMILENKNFNQIKKQGVRNPFVQQDRVVICSYNFAAGKQIEIHNTPWDLVVIDEAHRLRNVYKPSNVIGNKLKTALDGKRKLLLTATPLQNNLMELYGLVSIIDDRVFSDPKTFREKYVNVDNEEARNVFLNARIKQFCKRTLRKQVIEYVSYTQRTAILEPFTPSPDEEQLYNDVSEYLRSPTLYALPNSQRSLMTMILRKLLASSSYAISGTLDSLIHRLEKLLQGVDEELNLDDYDSFDELLEELELNSDDVKRDIIQDRQGISLELDKLKQFAGLAKSIETNAKGQKLLFALQKGFDETEQRGGRRRAVIFTESRRTERYLYNLLSENGYEGRIVFLDGSNSDANSKRIYKEWLTRHKGEEIISGSRQADMKAAVVEEFRDRASILIGTEAAAEGINLQFCSLVVNYDLPWNPQRIEQRIGRCHRYGQKNDVVVVNFLNNNNEADKRVYELLDEKFQLFNGLFGSSDEVLGSIESGVDFEKRIADIYQNCKTAEQIKAAFDKIQEEYKERIDATMSHARQTLLENFDEEVASRLKNCDDNTIKSVGQYGQWLYHFVLCEGGEAIKPLNGTRLYYDENDEFTGCYNLSWKDSEERKEQFLRREHPLCQKLMARCQARPLPVGEVLFDYTNSGRNISFFDVTDCKSGWITINKLSNESFETEEYLLITTLCDDNTAIPGDMINRIMELPAICMVNNDLDIPQRLYVLSDQAKETKLKGIEAQNKKYFLDECEKLDTWSEERKIALQQELKDIDRLIKEKKREISLSSSDCSLEELVEKKAEEQRLKKMRERKRREHFEEEDRIEMENERLQEEMRHRIRGRTTVEHIFTIRYAIV
ncbi:MAG: SNF2-related protein [Desulfotomaculaceae bacterium]|nr:SNF2-related protein [Desulfotomaculaceae bacterium]